MVYPIKNPPMPHAAPPKGNLGTSGGGKPEMKPMSRPYEPPKGPRLDGKHVNHGQCGTQGKY